MTAVRIRNVFYFQEPDSHVLPSPAKEMCQSANTGIGGTRWRYIKFPENLCPPISGQTLDSKLDSLNIVKTKLSAQIQKDFDLQEFQVFIV